LPEAASLCCCINNVFTVNTDSEDPLWGLEVLVGFVVLLLKVLTSSYAAFALFIFLLAGGVPILKTFYNMLVLKDFIGYSPVRSGVMEIISPRVLSRSVYKLSSE
jgi:hypothetical protein